MLVDAGLVSRAQLDEILIAQQRDGRRLGILLVEAGLVSEIQLTQLLSQQLSIPWVSLYHIDFSRKLLELVSRSLAEEHCVIPVFVRKIRGIGRTLYVAMDDPGDDAAKQAVAEYSGLPVRAMIAPPSDIRSAVRAYYGESDEESDLGSIPAAAVLAGRETIPDPFPALTVAAEDVPTTMPSVPPQATEGSSSMLASWIEGDSPDDALEPEVEVPSETEASLDSPREAAESVPSEPRKRRSVDAVSPRASDMPAPRRGPASRNVTLTLLDGTEIQLPAKAGEDEAGNLNFGTRLTARDLIQALIARSHGADATEVLGEDPRWESAFAAMLSILLKKHLIADWEFAEEYRRFSQGR